MKLYAAKIVENVPLFTATTKYNMDKLVRVGVGRDQALQLFSAKPPRFYFANGQVAINECIRLFREKEAEGVCIPNPTFFGTTSDTELNRIYSKKAVFKRMDNTVILYEAEITDADFSELKRNQNVQKTQINIQQPRQQVPSTIHEVYDFAPEASVKLTLLSASTQSHTFYTDEVARKNWQHLSEDKINHQAMTNVPNFSFLFKWLEALAALSGVAMFIVGIVVVNPVLLYAGACVAVAGSVALAAQCGLFSKKPIYNPTPTEALHEAPSKSTEQEYQHVL